MPSTLNVPHITKPGIDSSSRVQVFDEDGEQSVFVIPSLSLLRNMPPYCKPEVWAASTGQSIYDIRNQMYDGTLETFRLSDKKRSKRYVNVLAELKKVCEQGGIDFYKLVSGA